MMVELHKEIKLLLLTLYIYCHRLDSLYVLDLDLLKRLYVCNWLIKLSIIGEEGGGGYYGVNNNHEQVCSNWIIRT